jgi:hypothetical protein
MPQRDLFRQFHRAHHLILLYFSCDSDDSLRSATSKVGVNMIAARINQEHEKENLAAFALHPGVVETDMVSSPSISSLFISLPYVLITKSYSLL